MSELDDLETLTYQARVKESEEESVSLAERESSQCELTSVVQQQQSQPQGSFAWNTRVQDIGMANQVSGRSSPESLSREPSETMEERDEDAPTLIAGKNIFRHGSSRDLIDANGYTVGMSMI